MSVDEIHSLYGSLSVKGEITTSFKHIDFVNASLGVGITYQRGYQVINGTQHSCKYVISQKDIERYSAFYIKAWQAGVSTSDIAYYHYWAWGHTGVVEGDRAAPFGSFAPVRLVKIVFSIHKVAKK